MLTLLFLGEVMHELDFAQFRALLGATREKHDWDLVLCSANHLLGTTTDAARQLEGLFDSGIDVILTGEKALARPSSRKYLAEGQGKGRTPGILVRPLNFPAGTPGTGASFIQRPGGGFWVVCLDTGSDRRPLEDPNRSFEAWLSEFSGGKPVIVGIQGHNLALKKALPWKFTNTSSPIHWVGYGLGAATAEPTWFSGRTFVADAGAIEVEGSVQGQSPEHWWQAHNERNHLPVLPPVGNLRGDAFGCSLENDFTLKKWERFSLKNGTCQ